MNPEIAVSAATVILSLAYLAWPMFSYWYRVERCRHTYQSMTLAVLGNNGKRVKVTLRKGPSGRFEEPEIEKLFAAIAEADRAETIATSDT